MSNNDGIERQETEPDSASIKKAANSLEDFWDHQLKRIKKYAEDQEHFEGDGPSRDR